MKNKQIKSKVCHDRHGSQTYKNPNNNFSLTINIRRRISDDAIIPFVRYIITHSSSAIRNEIFFYLQTKLFTKKESLQKNGVKILKLAQLWQ